RLLDMSQAEAEKMKRDLPDALVIPEGSRLEILPLGQRNPELLAAAASQSAILALTGESRLDCPRCVRPGNAGSRARTQPPTIALAAGRTICSCPAPLRMACPSGYLSC